jgi:flagellar biosynthetic protein FliR
MSATALGADPFVLARCAGFVFRAPGFSHPDVPPPVRAGFAYALALALSNAAPGLPANAIGLLPGLLTETCVGAAIGVAASMLYDGAFSGGRALDDYAGIRASVPNANVAAGAGFGRLWSLAFAAAFFAAGGYRVALEGFAQTFVTLPPGALAATPDIAHFAIALPATLLRAALFVAGPAIAIAFVLQVSLALIARLVPRFSTFALAFPIVLGGVLLATALTLPWALPAAAHPWFDLTLVRAR